MKPVTLVLLVLFSSQSFQLAQTGPCATVIPGNPLPDLIIDGQRLKADVIVTVENFDKNSCAVIEGCVSSKGTHQLLRFTTSTANIGLGDLVIGDPNTCSGLFVQSLCHNHFHLDGYTDYRVWTEQGYATWVQLRQLGQPTNVGYNANLLATLAQSGDLIVGRKQGFCIIDTDQYLANAPSKKYNLCGSPGTAGYQGLTVGWSDTYGQQLDCQWVEIDRLRDGIYYLENHANPDHVLPESDYTNNTASVKFHFIPKRGKNPAQVIILS